MTSAIPMYYSNGNESTGQPPPSDPVCDNNTLFITPGDSLATFNFQFQQGSTTFPMREHLFCPDDNNGCFSKVKLCYQISGLNSTFEPTLVPAIPAGPGVSCVNKTEACVSAGVCAGSGSYGSDTGDDMTAFN